LLVQVLFGHQIFSSDDWATYSEETIHEIGGLLRYCDAKIISCIEESPDYYRINFQASEDFVAHINLSSQNISLQHPNTTETLSPYESLVLKK